MLNKLTYYQVKVGEASSKLLKFNKWFDRYKFTRMPFDIRSVPEIWQRIESQMFHSLYSVEAIIDGIIIWGSDVAQHNERVCHVLKRCRKRNVTLNMF